MKKKKKKKKKKRKKKNIPRDQLKCRVISMWQKNQKNVME